MKFAETDGVGGVDEVAVSSSAEVPPIGEESSGRPPRYGVTQLLRSAHCPDTMSAMTALAPTSPAKLSLASWGRALVRVYKKSVKDNIGLISAGVAYYGFLTLVPALGALVLTYGLVTSPGEVATQMRAIVQHVPADAAKLIDTQLSGVVHTSTGKKGLGLALALVLALYGAIRAPARSSSRSMSPTRCQRSAGLFGRH